MITCLLLLSLVCAGQQAPSGELAELAAEGRWSEVRELADLRLVQRSDDPVAQHWLGRAQLEEAWVLLDGDRLARDLGRSVLSRAIEQLAAGGDADPGGEWLLRARYTWFELHDGRDELTQDPSVVDDLERAWEQQGSALAAYLRGWVARLRGEPSAPWFRRAAEVDPPRATFALQWSRELASDGDRDGAVQAWSRALEAGDATLDELLATLVQALPAAVDAAARLELIDRLGQEQNALVAWYRAHAAGQLGRPDLALAAFDAGVEARTPAADRAHAGLLAGQGREDEAVALLLPLARERDWEALDQLVGVADGLAMERRFADALTLYAEALAIEPRHEMAQRHRAITLWHAGRDAEALSAWTAIVQRAPGRSDLVNDAALAAWGCGDLALARRLLEQAVALPGSIDARENLAVLLLDQGPGETDRALELLDAVLAEDPGRDRALVQRYRALRSH